eukprot:1571850-Rhodomonas_salina.3
MQLEVDSLRAGRIIVAGGRGPVAASGTPWPSPQASWHSAKSTPSSVAPRVDVPLTKFAASQTNRTRLNGVTKITTSLDVPQRRCFSA